MNFVVRVCVVLCALFAVVAAVPTSAEAGGLFLRRPIVAAQAVVVRQPIVRQPLFGRQALVVQPQALFVAPQQVFVPQALVVPQVQSFVVPQAVTVQSFTAPIVTGGCGALLVR